MKKFKLITILLAIIFIISLSASSILGWLVDSKNTTFAGETSELTVNYIVWFDQNGDNVYDELVDIDENIFYKGETDNNLKVLEISVGDQTAQNYIGKLRIKLAIATNSSYYIRSRFNNEWFMQRTSRATGKSTYSTMNQSQATLMPYGLDSSWYYNAPTNYVYHQNLVNTNTTIDVVNMASFSDYQDFSNSTYTTKYFVYLNFETEFVQANRMSQIWKINSIPNGN